MKKLFCNTTRILLILSLLILQVAFASQAAITLNGHDLTIEQLVQIASQHTRVVISQQARNHVIRSHQLVLLAASKNIPVYGLNRGVGLNKDRAIFQGDVLMPKARRASEKFNMNDIYATSAAVGPIAKIDVVRAAMGARLNALLLGNSGIQVDIVDMLAAFLNDDITPIFPSRGSIGEADITILAHLGLAVMGQGKVSYHGQIMPASQALKLAGLKPVHLYAKDALALFSSNAYTAGLAALNYFETEKLINLYELIFSLSLEAIDGNIAPLLVSVHTIRPYPNMIVSANNIRRYLAGSYLNKISTKRALQDPLSFRTASQVSGATRAALADLKRDLTLQLNSSDDNPAVILDIRPTNNEQEKTYYVAKGKLYGAVIPTANFEPIPWVLDVEKLNIALGHMSASATQRIVKLSSICINKLSRFLAPNKETIAFAAIQKPIMFLNTEIQQRTIPVSTISYPVAGGIEDTATNSLLVVENMKTIVDNLYQIMGFELLHASQAISLKKQRAPKLRLGKSTSVLYEKFRETVPFLHKDRALTPDIDKSNRFVRRYNI